MPNLYTSGLKRRKPTPLSYRDLEYYDARLILRGEGAVDGKVDSSAND